MPKILTPTEMRDFLKGQRPSATEVLDTIISEDLEKAKKEKSEYVNSDGTFKGGFKGCVAYQQSKGKSEESARKLCAYIGRRAGKIP